MNQKLIIGLVIECVGALGCSCFPLIFLMTFNKWILIAFVLSFVTMFTGFMIASPY